MDITAVKTNVDQGSSRYRAPSGTDSSNVQSLPIVAVAAKGGGATEVTAATTTTTTADKKAANVADLKKMTEAMNHSLKSMNTNIRFKYHEKTKELMVQVVDESNDKVLKEIPSHEFLDTIAAIRECVGVMLDKKM